ncbi:MAG: DUF4340 domain-containing protein [Oligoflexales bacterium]|nr:DUF4340 domain-containing protein [Oligoflexales bacterium]
MQKSIKILGGALLLQLVLFSYLKLRKDSSTDTFQATEALLALNIDNVDKVHLEDNSKKSLTLTKVNGEWQLDQPFKFPASPDKVRELLKSLAEIKRSWPAGKTLIAAKQFDVVEEKFERRLSFYQGDKKLQTLYVGSSPSFRKAHVRLDGEELTYAITLNTYDLPILPIDWFNKKVYEVERSQIAKVELPNLTLTNEGGDFKLSDLKPEEETDTAKSNALISNLVNPLFDDVISDHDDASKKGSPVLHYAVHRNGGQEKLEFAYFESTEAKAAEEKPGSPATDKKEDVVLKVSNMPYLFKMKRSRLEEVLKADRLPLIRHKAENKSSGAGTEGGMKELGKKTEVKSKASEKEGA